MPLLWSFGQVSVNIFGIYYVKEPLCFNEFRQFSRSKLSVRRKDFKVLQIYGQFSCVIFITFNKGYVLKKMEKGILVFKAFSGTLKIQVAGKVF